jgi:fumarate hydratase class II
MTSFHVQGCDLAVSLAAQAGQLELNVMMPIIAHNLFEMEHVLIGAIKAFTEKCVLGLTANAEKAHGWLAKNAIVATALNPLIGYLAAAELVKDAMKRNMTIRDAAAERIERGALTHQDSDKAVTLAEIDALLGDLHRLTEGGLGGPAGGG